MGAHCGYLLHGSIALALGAFNLHSVSVKMSSQIILTLMGRDQPGLVESVASVVAKHEGNWLESRMCQLGSQFAGILRISVEEENLSALTEALDALSGNGLAVTYKSEPAGEAIGAAKSLATFEVMGQDRPGIVSRITQVLAGLGVNVEELHTEITTAPMSAECLFKARGNLELPASLQLAFLQEQLETVETDLMVDFHLREEL